MYTRICTRPLEQKLKNQWLDSSWRSWTWSCITGLIGSVTFFWKLSTDWKVDSIPISRHVSFCAATAWKCPNIEFSLIRIFSHSDWIRRDTEYLSLFSLNARKCGPEKTPYLDTFHAVCIYNMIFNLLPFRKQYSWSFFLRPYSPLWSHSSSQRSAVILPPIWKKCLFYFVDFPKFFLIVNQL